VPAIRFKEFSGEWEEKKFIKLLDCYVPLYFRDIVSAYFDRNKQGISTCIRL